LSRGSLSIFWANALVGTLMTLGLLLLLSPLLTRSLKLLRPPTGPATSDAELGQ